MTSLILTPMEGFSQTVVPEWGTNKPREKVPLWSAKAPTWHLSGEPIRQFYDLTQLKKSNVRSNDQLLPKPQESTMGRDMIHKPFPAEHPYASHMSRLKMFPSFSTTAEEPKRGVEALNTLPLSSETPAANYDIEIIHKMKGTADRHEVQSLPHTSQKKGLLWHENNFNQGVKVLGDRQSYYPIPPTSVVPNLMPREGTPFSISDRNANTTRNLERQQWKTTYERNHTGIGPANQYKLDNLNDKQQLKIVTGAEDDNLYPWFTNSYDSPRPQEGRLSLAQNPNYGVPQSRGAAQEDTGYVRKPTLTEKEENRLLNGSKHLNLPDTPQEGKDTQWKDWAALNNTEARFEALIQRQMRNAPDPLPYKERGTDALGEEKATNYMEELDREHHESIQQMEAENRWNKLEQVKPSSDIGVLDRKLAISTPKEQVPAFYGHEGKYNEERAGLYKTSYDPFKLAYKLDDDPGRIGLRNTVGSHNDAIHYPTELNLQADVLRLDSETDKRKVPMFSDRPDIYEVYEPFKRDRALRLNQLQPNVLTARSRVQEGEVVNTTSTMGSGYNQEKFLQEYLLNSNARSEPLALMSSQNQNLANVRVNATKQVKFDDEVTVGEGAGNKPLKVTKASIETPKVFLYSPRTPTPRVVKFAPSVQSHSLTTSLNHSSPEFEAMQRSMSAFDPSRTQKGLDNSNCFSSLSDVDKLFLSQRSKNASQNLFESKQSNLGMGASSFDTYRSSYGDQFVPGSAPATGRSARYDNWEPGSGVPRPQTSLIALQNSFSKSAVHRKLNSEFPERNPSLLKNIDRGRKHEFDALNAQVLRGTLVSA